MDSLKTLLRFDSRVGPTIPFYLKRGMDYLETRNEKAEYIKYDITSPEDPALEWKSLGTVAAEPELTGNDRAMFDKLFKLGAVIAGGHALEAVSTGKYGNYRMDGDIDIYISGRDEFAAAVSAIDANPHLVPPKTKYRNITKYGPVDVFTWYPKETTRGSSTKHKDDVYGTDWQVAPPIKISAGTMFKVERPPGGTGLRNVYTTEIGTDGEAAIACARTGQFAYRCNNGVAAVGRYLYSTEQVIRSINQKKRHPAKPKKKRYNQNVKPRGGIQLIYTGETPPMDFVREEFDLNVVKTVIARAPSKNAGLWVYALYPEDIESRVLRPAYNEKMSLNAIKAQWLQSRMEKYISRGYMLGRNYSTVNIEIVRICTKQDKWVQYHRDMLWLLKHPARGPKWMADAEKWPGLTKTWFQDLLDHRLRVPPVLKAQTTFQCSWEDAINSYINIIKSHRGGIIGYYPFEGSSGDPEITEYLESVRGPIAEKPAPVLNWFSSWSRRPNERNTIYLFAPIDNNGALSANVPLTNSKKISTGAQAPLFGYYNVARCIIRKTGRPPGGFTLAATENLDLIKRSVLIYYNVPTAGNAEVKALFNYMYGWCIHRPIVIESAESIHSMFQEWCRYNKLTPDLTLTATIRANRTIKRLNIVSPILPAATLFSGRRTLNFQRVYMKIKGLGFNKIISPDEAYGVTAMAQRRAIAHQQTPAEASLRAITIITAVAGATGKPPPYECDEEHDCDDDSEIMNFSDYSDCTDEEYDDEYCTYAAVYSGSNTDNDD